MDIKKLQDLQATVRYEARKNGKVIPPKVKKDRSIKWLVPFDASGNLLWEAKPEYSFDAFGRMKLNMKSIVWKERFQFEDSLEINHLVRKRSALYVVAKSTKSMLQYSIFLKDLLECLKQSKIENGIIIGTWEFVKKGAYLESDWSNDKHLNWLWTLSDKALNMELTYQVRIAAGIVYKNTLISWATNSWKTHPFQSKFAPHPDAIYLHAETNVIKKALGNLSLKQLAKSSLYISRITFGNEFNKFPGNEFGWGMVKPCKGCTDAIVTYDIKKVFFTTSKKGVYAQL